ncbi:complement C1q tumor necrosis factor-related protein 1 isoform X1 [Bos javanicus]|uniref:complement C1q tumor necrosis factor-related protein 1 isoform X1 n=1 Tax=Bos javanicus TaxID=9906 RepID=UPI002AA63F1E|nr:complement C1q tumor necrosis factor-related protein 1 isoform X1 [Bos javanicus]
MRWERSRLRGRSHLAGICSLHVCPAFFSSSSTFEKPRFRFWPKRPPSPGDPGAGKGSAVACTTSPPTHPLPRKLSGPSVPEDFFFFFPSCLLSPSTSLVFPRPGREEAPPLGDAVREAAGRTRAASSLPDAGGWRDEEEHEKYGPRQDEEAPASRCLRCCDPGTPVYQAIPVPQINITILKGEKGDRGDRGLQGKYGKTGSVGARGHTGPKGQKGSMGAPGDRCKNHYAAFSVGRKKPLHSNDYYQTVIFDTEFVNLYSHFNMFTGKFYCYVPGIYFFSLNVHTWNQKETYLHIMKNAEEVVILYAQVSDRSIMQSQSLMLELRDQDEVWVRLFKGERENAIFSDEFDTYITFSGYLVKPANEP